MHSPDPRGIIRSSNGHQRWAYELPAGWLPVPRGLEGLSASGVDVGCRDGQSGSNSPSVSSFQTGQRGQRRRLTVREMIPGFQTLEDVGFPDMDVTVPDPNRRGMKILLPATGPAGRLPVGRVGDLARYLRSASPNRVQARNSETLKHSVLAKRMLEVSSPLVYRNNSLFVSFWLCSRMQRLRLGSATHDFLGREHYLARSVASCGWLCRGLLPRTQN